MPPPLADPTPCWRLPDRHPQTGPAGQAESDPQDQPGSPPLVHKSKASAADQPATGDTTPRTPIFITLLAISATAARPTAVPIPTPPPQRSGGITSICTTTLLVG